MERASDEKHHFPLATKVSTFRETSGAHRRLAGPQEVILGNDLPGKLPLAHSIYRSTFNSKQLYELENIAATIVSKRYCTVCSCRIPGEEEEVEPDYRKLDPASTPSSILIDGLSFAAEQGNALAHNALALLYAPSDDPLDAPSAGSEFWYTEEQNGRQLTGVEKEWADSYIAMVKHEEKYEHHLRKAGELGQFEALLELAERFGDPAFFVRSFTPSPSMDPARISRIAEELGRLEDARKWLAEAARQGDVEAMRELIEGYDSGDLEQCWTWFYLADLLGTNLSEDRYEAIHEDGSSYDDDVGGPLFVTGDDGVDLEPLDAAADAKAREAAKTLYESLMA